MDKFCHPRHASMNKGQPAFFTSLCDLHTIMTNAVQQYIMDVKSSDFPNEQEQY